MYFYIYKIKQNENEQIKLLEMCGDACICIRDGQRISGLNKNT